MSDISAIIPTIWQALRVVSRELVGFIPAVHRNSKAERAAVGQDVEYPIVGQRALETIVPGINPADSGDETPTSGTIQITNQEVYPILWTGEEEQALMNGDDPMLSDIVRQQFEQAFRTITNAVENDLGGLYTQSSRAYGTAGTTPFGTADELDDSAQLKKILDDNGAPKTDRHVVLDTAAGATIRGKQSALFKVNESGDGGAMLRAGSLGRLHGFDYHESDGVQSHTKGTGTGYLINDAGLVVGAVTIAADTGSGTIVPGDIVTMPGSTDKYVVITALGGGSFVIGAPGLRVAEADNGAITVGNDYTANMAFHRHALHLVARAPVMPKGGDAAGLNGVANVVDPVSGLVFQVARYAQYRRVKLEIGLAWGVKNVAPEHTAILLG